VFNAHDIIYMPFLQELLEDNFFVFFLLNSAAFFVFEYNCKNED